MRCSIEEDKDGRMRISHEDYELEQLNKTMILWSDAPERLRTIIEKDLISILRDHKLSFENTNKLGYFVDEWISIPIGSIAELRILVIDNLVALKSAFPEATEHVRPAVYQGYKIVFNVPDRVRMDELRATMNRKWQGLLHE